MTSCLPLILLSPWIIASDVRRHVIPNRALLALLALIELVHVRSSPASFLHINLFAMYLLAGGICMRSGSKGRIGMGDVKLFSLLGLILGSLSKVLTALTCASLLGLVWLLVERKRVIPFAPALIGGALFAQILSS